MDLEVKEILVVLVVLVEKAILAEKVKGKVDLVDLVEKEISEVSEEREILVEKGVRRGQPFGLTERGETTGGIIQQNQHGR